MHHYFQPFRLLLTGILLVWQVAAGASVADAVPYSQKDALAAGGTYLDITASPHCCKAAAASAHATDSGGHKWWRFADSYQTSFTPQEAGSWQHSSSGKVWRLGIGAPGAYSLYISFQGVQLAPGVQLYVYNKDYRKVRGPYTASSLSAGTAFSIPPLEGDQITVELDVPDSVAAYGALELTHVYPDRLNFFGRQAGGAALLPPLACDEYINCENGASWQTEKRAVCKIIADGALCTGTLLANTSRSRTPYLLTAYHVIFDQQHAAEALFLFNYEYPHCGSDTVNDTQTVSGARLLATAENLDYALLQLNEPPPALFRPYYAGWDAASHTPDLPVVTIHHPGGQPKQVAMAYRYLSAASYTTDYLPNAFWNVQWDIGVTAPGSSGSPLFNKQHRLIGTLTGGTAACGRGGTDYFTQLAACWAAPAREGIPLMDWLDAAHTGQAVMDGYDPYGFDPSACSPAWNILSSETLEAPVAVIPGSSQPATDAVPLAEQFLQAGTLLLPAVYLNVAAVQSVAATDCIYLQVWEGANSPSHLLYSQKVFLHQLTKGINEVMLDSAITLQGHFFVAYEPAYSPASSLTLYRAAGRGKAGPCSMYAYVQGGWQAVNNIDKQYTTSLAIGISACYGSISRPAATGMRIYPNPCSNYLYFTLPTELIPDEVRCFDFKGSAMQVAFTPGPRHTVRFQLPQGAYVLQVRSGQQWFRATFLVGR